MCSPTSCKGLSWVIFKINISILVLRKAVLVSQSVHCCGSDINILATAATASSGAHGHDCTSIEKENYLHIYNINWHKTSGSNFSWNNLNFSINCIRTHLSKVKLVSTAPSSQINTFPICSYGNCSVRALECLLIKGALNAPQGSGSTVNIIISLADTLGRLFSSRSPVYTCSYAWSPPPHLSVWLISRAIHMEMAAIHRGNPGRATRSLPSLLPNQSLLLLPYFKVLYCLIASPSFFFQSSSGSISPSGWKPPRTCQFLNPFGCILCVCFWVLALWGWSRGHRVIFELTGNVGGMHHHRPCRHSGCNCLSRT